MFSDTIKHQIRSRSERAKKSMAFMDWEWIGNKMAERNSLRQSKLTLCCPNTIAVSVLHGYCLLDCDRLLLNLFKFRWLIEIRLFTLSKEIKRLSLCKRSGRSVLKKICLVHSLFLARYSYTYSKTIFLSIRSLNLSCFSRRFTVQPGEGLWKPLLTTRLYATLKIEQE